MGLKEFWYSPQSVAKSGYLWEYEGYGSLTGKSKINDPPYLVQKEQEDLLIDKTYSDYPSSLFSKFISLGQNNPLDRDILDFANEYGRLGEYEVITDPSSGQSTEGEPISIWESEICRMRHVVNMWKSLKQGDAFYGEHIFWVDQITPVFAIGEHFDSIWDIEKALKIEGYGEFVNPCFRWVEPLPPRVWNYGDSRGPAMYFVANTINNRLNPERGSRFKARVRPNIYIDHKKGEFQPSFRPSNLLALLWVQLYEAATGLKEFCYCEICNGLLDVTGRSGGKRVHDVCSNRRRQKKFREKDRK